MNETSHTEWIEQYLLGQLEGDSLKAFQIRMQQEAFRQEVEWQEQLVGHICQAGEDDLRQKLNRFHDTLPAIQPRMRTSRSLPWGGYISVAASVLVLLGVFWLYRSRLVPEPPEPAPQLVWVPLHTQPAGAAIDVADTLRRMAILLYPDTVSHYFFDDTLRLYGNWKPEEVHIWYDTLRTQYVLHLNGLQHELQRYVDTRLKR